MWTVVVYNLGVLAYFGPWGILGKKNCHNSYKFWTPSSLYVYIFVPNCSNIPNIYVLFTKIVERFWSRDVTDIWVLANFEPKNQTRKFLNYMKSLCADFFRIFSNTYFGTKCLKKSDKKNVELYQVLMYNFLRQNATVLLYYWYALKAWVSKNRFYFFFFSSSDTQKVHHLSACHAIGINSSLIFFFSALRF